MDFTANIHYEPMTGCWLWGGARFRNGYGRTWHLGKSVLAHRRSYEIHIGPIPDGMTLDHRCSNKACVNPDHLHPVTARENQMLHLDRVNGDRKLCPHGHVFTPSNTYTDRLGGRHCRACNRAAAKRCKDGKAAA